MTTEARRGSVVVRGERTDGTIGAIEVFDLDEESWRRFVLGKLAELGAVERTVVDLAVPSTVLYRQRVPPGHPRAKEVSS